MLDQGSSKIGYQTQNHYLPTSLCFLLVLPNLCLSLFVLKIKPDFLPFLAISGYSAIMVLTLWMVYATEDMFNLLFCVVIVAIVRFGIPGRFIVNISVPHTDILSTLTQDDWRQGQALALMGILSVILGWVLAPWLFRFTFRHLIIRLNSIKIDNNRTVNILK